MYRAAKNGRKRPSKIRSFIIPLQALGMPLALSFLVFGCGSAEPPGNPDVVATVQNQSFPFSSAKTFVLPNDVAVITDSPPASTPSTSTSSALRAAQATALDPTTKNLILNEIVANMTERGYVRLTDPAGPKPDIFIQASVMQTTSTTIYYDYWYGYWGGYYDPWYGSTYAGYAPYPVPTVVTSTLGALVMDFTDPNAADTANKKLPSVWVGVVTGAVSGSSTSEIQSRVQSGIDQAFEQSPFIRSQP